MYFLSCTNLDVNVFIRVQNLVTEDLIAVLCNVFYTLFLRLQLRYSNSNIYYIFTYYITKDMNIFVSLQIYFSSSLLRISKYWYIEPSRSRFDYQTIWKLWIGSYHGKFSKKQKYDFLDGHCRTEKKDITFCFIP